MLKALVTAVATAEDNSATWSGDSSASIASVATSTCTCSKLRRANDLPPKSREACCKRKSIYETGSRFTNVTVDLQTSQSIYKCRSRHINAKVICKCHSRYVNITVDLQMS